MNNEQNGYLVSQSIYQFKIEINQFYVCTDQNTKFGVDVSTIQIIGVYTLYCDFCTASKKVGYGICIDDLQFGTLLQNQTFTCIYPFILNGSGCVCVDGYILNTSTCINVLSFLSNQNQIQQEIIDNVNQILQDITVINTTSSRIISDIFSMNQTLTMTTANTTNIIKLLNDNISQINNDINGKISALNKTVYILNNLTNQCLGEINDSLITFKQVLQKEIENLNITVNQQIANTSILNNSIQNDLQVIRTNIDILNLSVDILQTNITSIFSQITNLSQQSNSDIACINKSLADLSTQTTVNNQNLSSLYQNLQIINGTLTTNIKSLQTDLSEINSSLINLKNVTLSTVNVTQIFNNLTSINFTSAQLRTDLSLLNQTQYQEIVDRQNGDNNLQLQINNLVSVENSIHAQLQTKSDLINNKVDQLTVVSQNNYTKLNHDITYANNNCTNKITECQNNINNLWIALHDIQQNVYTKDQVDGNFTKYNAMLINSLSVKAQKKDYCSEKFAYFYNNSLIFYNYPFFSQMDRKCCASNSGMTALGLGPNDVMFSYLCSNWQDPDTTRGPEIQTQRYVESICGVYPCSNQIPYDQVCE
ncbi:Hypothetical_protein [Hexamita inflata]|uniref:Hypothetical_protein n=1 Tax=Hexamita inflata TaxID=28002 RepID=A0AA86PSA7_9EUKA|nr:Hypothetical protein HINF_LOCUS30248 [Hexamita inflata]